MREYHLNMTGSGPCDHRSTRVELTPSGPHYGKTLCVKCGKFMGWEKNPAVTEEVEERSHVIDHILNDFSPTKWEQEFLGSIRDKRHISQKQNACYLTIMEKYL